MLTKGVTPRVVTYSTILHGLFRTGRFSEAKELYLNMIKSGKQWSIHTYIIIYSKYFLEGGIPAPFKVPA
jgi:leucine-rich PPR motif-containing protein